MNGLPLRFTKEGLIERYQVEGMDPSDRPFNRTVYVNRTADGHAGKVTYQAFVVEGTDQPTTAQRSDRSPTSCSGRVHTMALTPQLQRSSVPGRKRNVGRLSGPSA